MVIVIPDLLFLQLKPEVLRHFITDNINGILGTTIFHLLLTMCFLFVKIGKVREFHQEQLIIEFSDETALIEEIIQSYENIANIEMPALDQQTIRSIAKNVADNLEQEISTDMYEKQVMEELGIESLEPEVPENFNEDMTVVEKEVQEEDLPPDEIVNTIIKDNTVVTYNLENRWHKYIYIPAYKCEGGGTVMLSIEVDQQGAVVSASIMKDSSTIDPCLLEEAENSVRKARFNASPNALPKQFGTITYVFLPQ